MRAHESITLWVGSKTPRPLHQPPDFLRGPWQSTSTKRRPRAARYVDPFHDARALAPLGAEERTLLRTVNQKIAARPSLRGIVDYLFERTQSLIPCDRMGLAFVDDKGEMITSYYNRASYEPLRIDKDYAEPLSESSLRDVLQHRPAAHHRRPRGLRAGAPAQPLVAAPRRRGRALQPRLPAERRGARGGVHLSQLARRPAPTTRATSSCRWRSPSASARRSRRPGASSSSRPPTTPTPRCWAS